MGNKTAYGVRFLFIVIACACAVGCGDDDSEPADAGTDGDTATSGRGGTGGTGGRAGRGATGGNGGRGAAGRGTAGTGMMAQCSEPAPTEPVVCGGQTCQAPTYEGNECVVPCCATVDGAQVCGAKSTNPMFMTGCEPPITLDPTCPGLPDNDPPLEGCCNKALGVCGIVSTLRPGCITMSSLVELPENPQACGDPGDDAGVDEDAGR